jgi:hypothetical protein
MADYYPLIARAVADLSQNTDEARCALYERARSTLVTQLRGQTPKLTESQITQERRLLEEAIQHVENDSRPVVRVSPTQTIEPGEGTKLVNKAGSNSSLTTKKLMDAFDIIIAIHNLPRISGPVFYSADIRRTQRSSLVPFFDHGCTYVDCFQVAGFFSQSERNIENCCRTADGSGDFSARRNSVGHFF